MADITNLFKATVKTLKTRQKAQGLNTGVDKSILRVSQKSGVFTAKAKDVVGNISELKVFLEDHRKDYINNSYSQRNISNMTDADRDQIDADAETFMRLCSESIKTLKTLECVDKQKVQMKEHQGAIVTLIEAYLKVVCGMYSEQRAVRVKRVVDRKRMSRLAPEPTTSTADRESFQSRVSRTEGIKEGPIEGAKVPDSEKEGTSSDKEGTGSGKSTPKKAKTSYNPHLSTDNSPTDDLSPDEIQMFERENQQLYQEMNSMVDEVKQIEGKVVEISQLQEIFADKVLEQEKDIDRIADTVVGTTENIKEANEDIREAMKNNAGLRVWILFFLIVLSFTLLFLDWYNP